MPRIRHLNEDTITEVSTEVQNLSIEDISTRLSKHDPILNGKVDISKILAERGLTIENCVSHMVDLLETTQDERIRKDIILESLDMHGVRKKETNDTPLINLVIQDRDVKIQNVLLPERD